MANFSSFLNEFFDFVFGLYLEKVQPYKILKFKTNCTFIKIK